MTDNKISVVRAGDYIIISDGANVNQALRPAMIAEVKTDNEGVYIYIYASEDHSKWVRFNSYDAEFRRDLFLKIMRIIAPTYEDPYGEIKKI
jgi:hypothetical protein